MEVAKITMALSPLLDPQEKEMILAKNGERIKEMPIDKVNDQMLILIGKTHIECGIAANEGTIRLSMPLLLKDLISYFGNFTMNEIAHSFKLGIMKEYGEWYGLNNKTFFQWLRGYLGSTKRLDANKKQAAFNAEKNKPKALTDEEKEALMKKGALEAFEYVKTTGKHYPDLGSATYNWLDRKKLIHFTIDRKKAFIGVAMDNLRSNMVNEIDRTPTERKAIQARIMELSHTDDIVKTEAKKIALNVFFREMIEIGQELKDILP
jgi:hypothetical protein